MYICLHRKLQLQSARNYNRKNIIKKMYSFMGLSEPCQMKIYMLSKSHKCMAKRKRQPFLLCMCVCAHEHIYIRDVRCDVCFCFGVGNCVLWWDCCILLLLRNVHSEKHAHTKSLSQSLDLWRAIESHLAVSISILHLLQTLASISMNFPFDQPKNHRFLNK